VYSQGIRHVNVNVLMIRRMMNALPPPSPQGL
jgi:hypothetical protein